MKITTLYIHSGKTDTLSVCGLLLLLSSIIVLDIASHFSWSIIRPFFRPMIDPLIDYFTPLLFIILETPSGIKYR